MVHDTYYYHSRAARNPSEWWRCRARDSRVGYLPSPYLETIQRKPAQQAITAGSPSDSRTNTMNTTTSNRELAVETNDIEKKPEIKGKMGDISPESFQKGTFHS